MKNTKSVIPPRLRDELSKDPFYKVCALCIIPGHTCEGEISWEHAIIHAGHKVNTRWAIVPLCEKYHDVGAYQDSHSLSKELNVWVALSRTTDQQLREMCGEGMFTTSHNLQKSWPWVSRKAGLIKRFGPYCEAEAIQRYIPPVATPRVSTSHIAPFTVDLTNVDKKMVQECIEFYADNLNIYFTPKAMVQKMIKAAYEALPSKDQLKETSL